MVSTDEQRIKNRERQAKYKQRQLELNADAYRAKLAEVARKRYNDKKPVIEEIKIEPVKPLNPIKKRINKINKNELKDDSIATYKAFIKNFYNYYTNKHLEDNHEIFKTFTNDKYKYKIIKEDFNFLFNTKIFNDIIARYHKRLNILYAIITRIYGFTPIVKKLYPYFIESRNTYQNDRAERIIPDDILNSVSFKPDDIINKIDNSNLKINEKLIASITLLMPTRRLHDYRFCKIAKSKPDDTFDKSFNYYFNKQIYIYNTKNKKYDILNIPDEVIKYIDLNYDWLFLKFYSEPSLSRYYTKIMTSLYGIKINNTMMRILFSTYLRGLNLSGLEYEKVANKMGHSLSENLKYSYVKK